MLAGELYDSLDPELVVLRTRARDLAGALILPGVRVGSRTVIGAGSVVTRDLPDDVFAAGNPCRVVRPLSR